MEEQQALPSPEMSIGNPNLPRLYTNYIIGGHGFSDVFLVTSMNGHPNLVINMPPKVAKQLREMLG